MQASKVIYDHRGHFYCRINSLATLRDQRYNHTMPFTPRLVLVTASNKKEARQLAAGILKERFAACVNLIPEVESHYWWKGKIEKAAEVTLLIKSSAEQFDTLAGYIRKHHSYECPEIVAIAIHEISPAYRSWWDEAMMKPSD